MTNKVQMRAGGQALAQREDPVEALSASELADYACGLLGPLRQMARRKDLDLLAHLVGLAYEEACWQRQSRR